VAATAEDCLPYVAGVRPYIAQWVGGSGGDRSTSHRTILERVYRSRSHRSVVDGGVICDALGQGASGENDVM